jgi:pimeloyl-ACP methyl ester carboxylesterase
MPTIKFLGVHGLGDHRQSPWKADWERAVRAVFPLQDRLTLDFQFVTYDDIFEQIDVSAWESTVAVTKLLRSGVASIFRPRGARAFGERKLSDTLRWTAGYVVAWVEDEDFQAQTRARLADAIKTHQPDVLLGHSLGSLVSYNLLDNLPQDPALVSACRNLTYVTLGSQIGNPFVVGNLAHGRIRRLDVHRWYHLYNEEDDVFTAPIRLFEDNFSQVDTPFDIEGMADHSAEEYLRHAGTTRQVWEGLAGSRSRAVRGIGKFKPLFAQPTRVKRRPRKRALLVGINAYPNAEDRLEGCVNDVFLVSEVLQERGFDAEDIRVCLDDRATARGVLERFEWLLDTPQPDDQLVFYYSGHGAQLPTYGLGDRVDRMDETLVPYDFDWSPDTAITDDQVYELYGQLPYETQLLMMFDCCHSGGIHKAGARRVRGLNPPDDIRHRALRWNPNAGMWEDRDLRPLNKAFGGSRELRTEFFGSNDATTRIGRASSFRKEGKRDYDERKQREGGRAHAPYLPVILEACRESEFSYEYRHGVTSYGAFTFALAAGLRRSKSISFNDLVKEVRKQLRSLQYDQQPQVLGPSRLLKAPVPWLK